MFQYNKFSSSGKAGSDYSEQTHSRKRDEAMALCGTRLLLDFSIDIKYRPLHAINLMFTSRTQKKTENAISFALISYSVSAEAEAENAAFQSNLTLHYDYIFFSLYSRNNRHLPGVNFINILQATFTCADPKSAKKAVKSRSFLSFWDLCK